MSMPRRVQVILLGIVLFGAGFAFTAAGKVSKPELSARVQPTRYRPLVNRQATHEIAFVYVGSSTCTPSNAPDLPRVIEALKLRLQREANVADLSFAAIGIARDSRSDEGLRHLGRFGYFDEVMAGRSWRNIGLLKYFYETHPGPAATPQIVLLMRRLTRGDTVGIADERVIARKVGLYEIRNWLQADTLIPHQAGALTSLSGTRAP